MNLLHRYVFREVLVATVVAVAVFTFIFLGGTAVRDLIGRATAGQISVLDALSLLISLTPFVMTYSLPMGVLTAVLLVLGRISAQNEVTAMRTAGIGLTRIAAPIMLVAIFGVVLSLLINFVYAPAANQRYRRILFEVSQKNPMAFIIPGTFVRDFPGALVYVGKREGGTLRDIWLWRTNDQHKVVQFVWMEEGELRWDENRNVLQIVSHGLIQPDVRKDKDPENFSGWSGAPTADGNGATFDIPLDRLFKRSEFRNKISWMDLKSLLAARAELRSSADFPSRLRRLEIDMSIHEKASLGFSVLSFAMLAVPLGIQTRRKETSANLGLALGLTLVFYAVLLAVQWLNQKPQYHPELLQWLPNFGFQGLGGLLWWRLGRN